MTAEGLTLSIDGVELLHNVHFSRPGREDHLPGGGERQR